MSLCVCLSVVCLCVCVSHVLAGDVRGDKLYKLLCKIDLKDWHGRRKGLWYRWVCRGAVQELGVTWSLGRLCPKSVRGRYEQHDCEGWMF